MLTKGDVEDRPRQMMGTFHGLRMTVRAVEVLGPHDEMKEFMRDDFVTAIVVGGKEKKDDAIVIRPEEKKVA